MGRARRRSAECGRTTFFLDSYGAHTTTMRLLFVTVAGASLVLALAAVPRARVVAPNSTNSESLPSSAGD